VNLVREDKTLHNNKIKATVNSICGFFQGGCAGALFLSLCEEKDKMTIIHTKFLIHWTGKKFHIPTDPLNDELRDNYVEALINILENGFKMEKGKEEILDLDGKLLETFISRVCFTEIKLSLARKHAQRYGLLGLGVDRDFVLKRYGNPVFYMKSGDSNVAVNANKVLEFLKEHDKKGAILLEYRTLLAYFKNMNDKDSNDLTYYDELEWRITHLNRLEDEGRLSVVDRINHIYLLKLKPVDVKVLVFPDEKTKTQAFNDTRLSKLIEKPICLTIDDCENF